ncbi:Transposable element tcb2 transposase, partial [Caligus rogercresseyi]
NRALHYPKSTIYDQWKAWNSFKTNDAHRKKRSRSLRATRTDEFVTEVKRKVNEDGNKSYAKLATEMGCSKQTIANTINKDLGDSSYKKRHRMILTEGTRESRRAKAEALLNNLKHETAGILRFFSDEKFFSQDQNSNRQNDRWICPKCRQAHEVPLLRNGPGEEPQGQHGHIHRRHEERREALNGHGGEWEALCLPTGLGDPGVDVGEPPLPLEPGLVAPSSLQPPRLFLLGMVENKTNKYAHNTLDSLRATIVEEFANMKKDVVAKACGRFRHRLEMVVAADGDYIGNKYLYMCVFHLTKNC